MVIVMEGLTGRNARKSYDMHIIRYTLIRNNQVLSEAKGKCFKYRDLLLREDEFEMRVR